MSGCLAVILVMVVIGIIITYWPVALLFVVIYVIYKIVKSKKIIDFPKKEPAKPIKEVMNYDVLDGHQFEYFCSDVLKCCGYTDVSVTQGSGDYGVDIIANKDGLKYAIQCKCYSSNIGNKAVQEIYSGKSYYDCNIAVVLTNRYFTKSAINTADKNGVLLWNRNELDRLISIAMTKNNFMYVKQKSPSITENANYNLPEKTECGNLINKENTMEVRKSMYDADNGIYPSGNYDVGTDIPKGRYLLKAKKDKMGMVSIYDSYQKYRNDDMMICKTFDDDYYLTLREDGQILDVEDADIQKIN